MSANQLFVSRKLLIFWQHASDCESNGLWTDACSLSSGSADKSDASFISVSAAHVTALSCLFERLYEWVGSRIKVDFQHIQ